MKRPASATFDSADHYAVIWLDKEGKLNTNESPSIQGQGVTVFTPEVRQNFVATLRKWPKVDETRDTSFHSVKRPRGNTPDSATDDDRLESISDHCSPNGSGEIVSLRIGDTSGVISYYKSALEKFLVVNCRVVVKALIKVIEPRKRVQHPYSGRPRGSAPGSSWDPQKTKPEWWPSDVMHKEPDHLPKKYLIPLLLHIIRELRDWGITADKLKEAADDTRRSLKDPSRVEIIYEVLRVRHIEERFERGKVAASTVVHVMNHGRKPQGIEKEPTQPTSNAVAKDTFAEGPVTPTSTVEEIVSAVTTHVEVMPEAPRCLYDNASQPILSTPVATGILSTNSLVDFSDSTLFPNTSPGQPCTGGPGNYITSGTPQYPQDIFSQVHYSAPITAHDVPTYMYFTPWHDNAS